MTIKTDSYVIGSNADDTRNFLLDTDLAGALRIRRKSDGSGGVVLTIDNNNKITSGLLTLMAAQNTISGTSIDFTSIPSWVKRITVMLNGVSTNGTSNVRVQLGAGSMQTTGYLGSTHSILSNTGYGGANFTSGFDLFGNTSAADVRHGAMTFTFLGSNTWICAGVVGQSDAIRTGFIGGSVALGGTLDRLRLTTVNGTDTFDAGSVNVLYEG